MENELQLLIEQAVMLGANPLGMFILKALIGTGVSLGANKIFGGSSGSGSAELDRAGNLQADALQNQNRLFNKILGLINTTAQGGAPPRVRFDLDNPQDFGALFDGIAPMGELNQLKELLGLAPGGDTDALETAAALSERRSERSADLGGDIAGQISQLLLELKFGKRDLTSTPSTDVSDLLTGDSFGGSREMF